MTLSGDGLFISLEGIDGSGKSSQIQLLHQRLQPKLKALGTSLLITKEPSTALLGHALRKKLQDGNEIDSQALLLLFLADRLQHLKAVICPALDKGQIVLCDRFHDSTIAYQQYGQQLDLRSLEDWMTDNIVPFLPQLTLWLDASPEACQARIRAKNNLPDLSKNDRFDLNFSLQQRAAEGYQRLCQSSDRIQRVLAEKEPQAVHEQIWKLIEPKLTAWKDT